MAFSIKLNTPRYSAELAFSSLVTNAVMLALLAKKDPQGELIDKCNGNIKAAFATLAADKLFSIHHVHEVNGPAHTARRFNTICREFPLIFTEGMKDWGIKIISLEASPHFEIQMLEESA
ncbi:MULTISPECIES: hypothetical protein [Pseudoalteromonas]|jgi:hypothetical protein|uniref:hypothetical protein n=1 Tax=Pseudoalteromonas TaxID=53246 RepID=UPI0007C4A631|nr:MULTISPECIES: hypothetical protein [Pseudoalteromonas]MEC8139445.1 hypothetical protein [Pseudomonadota bacterium]MCG9708361.1 hypothetical protein [Pseudoalteromonas sp. Isolate3]QLJ09755.1 hypothetical protein GZH31_08105 [Pseudoalteromonas sp. JSTW]QMW15965.1 hypothetical protein H3302_07875 [Pseudoalteromonas sp. MT33b]TMP19105.1 hypothetical protein CWC02_08550 [Pseudoalteromonas sp. S2721]|tara:strand:- start:60 stop:419 length:360 start_codon:yes stop_codon:yes gene_type:complete